MGLTLLLTVSMLTGCGQKNTGSPAADLGTMPQENSMDREAAFGSFATLNLEGKAVTQDIWKNSKYTLVSVWGTYCGNCIDSMDVLEQVYQKYKDKGLNVMGIVIDAQNPDGQPNGEQVALAKDILKEKGVTYMNILSSENLNHTLMTFASAIPAYVFVDAAGNIVGTPLIGGQPYEKWVNIIEKELEL